MHRYPSDQKLWTFCHIYPVVFKHFHKTSTKLLTSALSYIRCSNFFISTALCYICHNSGFNPWLYVLTKCTSFKEILSTCHIYDNFIKNLMTSQGIYLHHYNSIVLKIPCAKFHGSSCSQHKVGGGGVGAVFPPTQKRGSKTLQKGLEMQNIRLRVLSGLCVSQL